MFDDVIIKGVTKIVNERVNRESPMMGHAVEDWQVEAVLQATYDLIIMFEKEKKNERSINKKT